MPTQQLTLTYPEIENLIGKVYRQLLQRGITPKSIYGIPRGGLLPAYALAKRFNCDLVKNNSLAIIPILIVDDILDSGETLHKYPNYHKAVLISKKKNTGVITGKYVEPGTWVTFPWEDAADEEEGIQRNITRILEYIGENPKREGLLETPQRVQKAYKELFEGYAQNPATILAKEFTTTYDQMVVLKNIEFFSFCEHHMLPFFGTASVAYIPRKKVVGISKLARLVDMYARRLQIQEQMTDQIADAVQKHLNPLGVAVTITAKHFCMVTRGVKKQNTEMTTTSLLGAFRDNPETRAEFFSRI